MPREVGQVNNNIKGVKAIGEKISFIYRGPLTRRRKGILYKWANPSKKGINKCKTWSKNNTERISLILIFRPKWLEKKWSKVIEKKHKKIGKKNIVNNTSGFKENQALAHFPPI
jgi:hypothetical protein